MTKKVTPPSTEHYIVPARQLSGTRDEVLAQIDELILGLTGLRQLVSLHGPTPAEAPRRKLHLVKGFLRVLFVAGIALWAAPAQGHSEATTWDRFQDTALVGGGGGPAPQTASGRRALCCSRLDWCGWGLRHSSHWSRSSNSAIACRR